MDKDLLIIDKPIENQKYVVMSFLCPDKLDNSNKNIRGIKIRGVFETYDKAKNFITDFQNDKTNEINCDLYIGDVGKWLPFIDDLTLVENDNVEYADKELNKLMSAYVEKKNIKKQIDFTTNEEKNEKNDVNNNISIPLEDEIKKMRKLLESIENNEKMIVE